MDYEEKYKSALKWMQSLYGGLHGATKEEAEKYFPELKESEDEKVRKALIEYFNEQCDMSDWNGIYGYKVVNWLEKQGENQHSHINVNKMVDKFAHTEVKGYGVPSMIEVDAYRKGIEDSLEKQGKQTTDKVEPKFKPGDTMRTWREAANGYTDGMPVIVSIDNEYYHCTNELIAIKDQDDYEFPPINVKQKSSDKVEPKFKVGDWIVLPLGIIARIDSLNSTDYQVTTTDGKICDFKISKQDNYRLWTIANAKDGDVLVALPEIGSESNEQIFLFKAINSRDYVDNCIEYYGRLCDGSFYKNKTGYMGTTLDTFYPATKEQRDLLFQKMKIVGYEWDSEKKELNKIEVKTLDPAKVIEWLKHRELSCDDVVTTVIPDDSPTSVRHKVKLLSDKFIEQFKKDFEI